MVAVVEALFALSSLVFVGSALTIAWYALQAYVRTGQRSMLLLALGLVIVVAGAAATLIGAFITDFGDARPLLFVNSLFFTVGFLLVMYSLVVHE